MSPHSIQLTNTNQQILACSFCQQHAMGKIVPGEGPSNASVVLVGEAPGKKEAETGRPFVGRSGIFLRSMMSKGGLPESMVFITSTVKYLPVQGTPTQEEIAHGKKHLFPQLSIISPRLVILLGRVACEALFGRYISVEKEHGSLFETAGFLVYVSYHPAAAIRFGSIREKFITDFSRIPDIIASLA